MTISTANGRTFHVHFRHPSIGQWRLANKKNGTYVVTQRMTTCTVHEGDCQLQKDKATDNQLHCVTTPFSAGAAVCSIEDQFEFKVGRKIAFTRAIQHYTRAERALLWDAWFRWHAVQFWAKVKADAERATSTK